MNSNREGTAINSSNSTPYLSAERNELSPLYSKHEETRGLRIIISCFTVLTIIVSVALATQLRYGDYQVIPHGSVVSDSRECSVAGAAIMKKGGSVVDAAITTSFCLAVVQPHLTGLGGGGFMLVYDQRQEQLTGCYDFRPLKGNHSSMGIPGFVAGMFHAHKKHGVLPWATLLEPAIQIARGGFLPSQSLMIAKAVVENATETNSALYNWFSTVQPGQLITNTELGNSLLAIARSGSDAFYNGSLSSQLRGYFSEQQLSDYRILSETCLLSEYIGYKVVVPGPGSGGPLLHQALMFLNQTLSHDAPLVSAALALKDNKEVSWPMTSGTHVAVVNHNDIYVSIVTGLGSMLGGKVWTQGGYILNNAFDLAPLGSDMHSTSLSVPIIAVQVNQICGHRFILGGSDARDAVQVLYGALSWATSKGSNLSLEAVVEAPRARITRTAIYLEENHVPHLDVYQRSLLNLTQYKLFPSPLPYPSLNAVHKLGDTVKAYSDSRGEGAAISF